MILKGCPGSEFGCCCDGKTAKANSNGSNCRRCQRVIKIKDYKGDDVDDEGACFVGRYGCCNDGKTVRQNIFGTNCPGYKPRRPIADVDDDVIETTNYDWHLVSYEMNF
jgi:hypothetical protein